MRARWVGQPGLWVLVLTVAACALACWWWGLLDVAPRRDETHYWPAALRFAASPLPDADLLKNYGEVSTPLAFLVAGWIEAATGLGIRGARLLDLALGAAVLAAVARGGVAARWGWRGAASALGLLAFPYFAGVAVHFYPDMLAGALVLAGFVLAMRSWWWASAGVLVLAVATRQYMVVFPLALACWRVGGLVAGPGGWRGVARDVLGDRGVWAMLLAAGSIGGWIAWWGGFGPRAELERHGIVTASLWRVIPHQSLYALSVIGAYYVIPEGVLLGERRVLAELRRARGWVALAAVGVLFAAFPPWRNLHYEIASFGYLDKALRAVAGDGARVMVLGLLAGLAVLRFGFDWRRPDAYLVMVHVGLMMKAQISWDKYALPVLVCLWWLRSREAATPRVGWTTGEPAR